MRMSKFSLLVLLLTAFMTACSEEETRSEESTGDQESKEVEKDNDNIDFLKNVPSVPKDTAGLIKQKQGKYAWTDVGSNSVEDDVIKDIKKLEPLPEEASEEQLDNYFKYMYSLVAEDFPDPTDTINKWEFGSFGNPDLPDARYHFKENYNIEIILDSSGSMAAAAGGKTRMQLAKETIDDFLKNIPEEANVSLRVYGHKGTSADSDKKKSCSSIEQIYGFSSYDEEKFQDALGKFQPSGWTPIADALEQAEASLQQYDTEKNTNLIYLVSDGIETCDGNPVQVAASFADSKAKPIINIIGFQAEADAQAQLEKVAEASDGIYATVNNQDQLEEEFNRAKEVLEAWEDWKEEALDDVDATEVDNSFDILAVSNDWGQQADQLSTNLTDLFYLAKDAEIIDINQFDEMKARKSDLDDLVHKAQDEVVNELENVSAEKLEEMKQSIEEKYNQQTEK